VNLLVDDGRHPRALLALEDGTCFSGRSAGAEGETFGEVVFNTSMVGYQEIVSDPSYAGQIVTFTYPQLGNYGINEIDMQATELHLRGLVCHDMCYAPSNWQSVVSLPAFLRERGIVAIEDVDTRSLTLRIREGGAMRAAISTTDLDPKSLVARVRASEPIADHNYVADVSTPGPYTVRAGAKDHVYRVVAYDCGEKTGIAKRLAETGCEVTVVPWDTPAKEVLAREPDGVFFSNGPGDPVSVPETVAAVRALLGKLPVFGICLGNQVISMAAGAQIEKLPYGHHGGNEPVMNLLTEKVEITAQNHNYGPVFSTLGPLVPELSGGFSEHRRRPALLDRAPHRARGHERALRPRSPHAREPQRRYARGSSVPRHTRLLHAVSPRGQAWSQRLHLRLRRIRAADGRRGGLPCHRRPRGEALLMPRRDDIKKILIIGSGPIVIGQACEFDYSGTQACKALRREGYEVVLVNSNPATIMTDPETADRTYIEPITVESVEKVIEIERPDALLPNMGGQTGLNCAVALAKAGVLDRYGVEVIGCDVDSIETGRGPQALCRLRCVTSDSRSRSPTWPTPSRSASAFADDLGYPVVIRPAFTLGGAGGGMAYDHDDLLRIAREGTCALT